MKNMKGAWGLAASAALITTACQPSPQSETQRSDPVTTEDRFAILALDCVHREYPNKISHVMQSGEDVGAPHELFPAFYGCFDWHSSVHGHWLLTRILTTQPGGIYEEEIRQKLARSFTDENIAGELAYYTSSGRASFERPYGIAWYLQLVAELEESDDPQLAQWRETLRPLEEAIVAQTLDWLPKLAYPVRLGTHNQTAFAFGLMLDYARTVGNTKLHKALSDKAAMFHLLTFFDLVLLAFFHFRPPLWGESFIKTF